MRGRFFFIWAMPCVAQVTAALMVGSAPQRAKSLPPIESVTYLTLFRCARIHLAAYVSCEVFRDVLAYGSFFSHGLLPLIMESVVAPPHPSFTSFRPWCDLRSFLNA